jgi:tetratricopeptide (TPR) repeat protein
VTKKSIVSKSENQFGLNLSFVEFVPTSELTKKYSSPRKAFSAGNYELAAHLAVIEKDFTTLAMARIMCGMVTSGLNELERQDELDNEAKIIRAFALWSLDRIHEAQVILAKVAKGEWHAVATNLTRLIKAPQLNILVFYNNDSEIAAPLAPGDGFKVQAVHTGVAVDVESSLALETDCFDLVLCLYSIPKDMHERVEKIKGPVVTAISDFDMNIPSHAPMLSRSDCILVGTSFEHHYLDQIYGARTASYPGMRLRPRPKLEASHPKEFKYDICFTGRAFKAYWPDKARMLFRIASLDNPDLRIKIFDGFLSSNEYDDVLESSRFNVLPNRYGFSLMHGRTLDALWQGCQIIGYGAVPPESYAPGMAQACLFTTEGGLENELEELLRSPSDVVQNRSSTLNEIFVDQPSKDKRTIKFSLFQTLLNPQTKERPAPINPDFDSRICLDAIQTLLGSPLDEELRLNALRLHENAIKTRPRAIIITFNYAQLLWILDRKKEAQHIFSELKQWVLTGELDPQRDFMISHRYSLFNTIVPYHAYNMAAVKQLASGSEGVASVRAVLASTVDNYLALNFAQAGNLDGAKALLKSALYLCPDNGAAAYLLAKVLYALEAPPGEIWAAIRQALELYPPYLHELLPFGISALEQIEQNDHAATLARQWAYFVTRMDWLEKTAPGFSDQTWKAAEKYASTFPESLRKSLEHMRRNSS